jgi:hypothetical protein
MTVLNDICAVEKSTRAAKCPPNTIKEHSCIGQEYELNGFVYKKLVALSLLPVLHPLSFRSRLAFSFAVPRSTLPLTYLFNT